MSDKDRRRHGKVAEKSDHRGVEITVCGCEFEVERKASASSEFSFFEGYASILKSVDSYNDIILPGFFEETIEKKGPRLEEASGRVRSQIKALWQHNPDWPFGLPHKMEEDSTGLWHRTAVVKNATNDERLDYMEQTSVDGQSIGFVTEESKWADEDDEDFDASSPWEGRYLIKGDLWEVSPVTFPAHSEALTDLVKRNRELVVAVKREDHSSILALATKMKGISVPMIEESIAVLTQVKDALAPNTEEAPDAAGDTSGDDPELVNSLEAFALQQKTLLARDRIKVGR